MKLTAFSRTFWIEQFFSKDAVFSSIADEKRALLTGFLGTVLVIVAIFYQAFDLLSGIFYSIPTYVVMVLTGAATISLLRRKHYTAAKVTLMLNANLIVFYSALNDPFGTGTCMLFIPAGTGSFAVLGFQERSKGIILATISLIFFCIAFFGSWHLPFNQSVSEVYLTASLLVNYVLSLSITVAIIYFLGSLNESSEQQLMAQQRSEHLKNVQLEKIHTELDRFVYSVSHDLRSPISSIKGLLTLAESANKVEDLRHCLTLIKDRIQAQEFYINEIIDFYHNDRAELRIESLNLKDLAYEIVDEYSYMPVATNIRFEIDISQELVVFTDRFRLKSILSNLVGNAVKYHARYKDDQFVKIAATHSMDYTEILVIDNGRGIDGEHLPLIFNMFYRASSESKGSGLGLYIVKETVNKLGGTIYAQSEVGVGSTFHFNLPLQPPLQKTQKKVN
ncbi:MAG: ATP-binding protein [Cyclobacteriaceae bacterium]